MCVCVCVWKKNGCHHQLFGCERFSCLQAERMESLPANENVDTFAKQASHLVLSTGYVTLSFLRFRWLKFSRFPPQVRVPAIQSPIRHFPNNRTERESNGLSMRIPSSGTVPLLCGIKILRPHRVANLFVEEVKVSQHGFNGLYAIGTIITISRTFVTLASLQAYPQ